MGEGDAVPEPNSLIPFVISLVLAIGIMLVIGSMIQGGPNSLPIPEGKNAEQAYEWYAETYTLTNESHEWYGVDYPTCSAMARCWVDEYREAHNLTPQEYTCAIWYNDMESYFYY